MSLLSKKSRTACLGLACLISGFGCLAPGRRAAVPDHLADQAEIVGMPCVRTWADEVSPEFLAELRSALAWEQDQLRLSGHDGPMPPADFLAVSGGGANGAFGAGLLCGWSESGTRPTFKTVTGISTGALTAPFAFLGPTYDDRLRDVYTRVRTGDILRPRGLVKGFFSDALADNTPLWRLIEKHVNDDLMRAVAIEWRKGRLLLVATTNLDAQRGVIWNLGAIADSGRPEALKLFQSILIASAAIPAAFPPVMIDVVADGQPFQEMHVDGGALAQVFLYPPSMRPNVESVGVVRSRRAYIIRNSRLDPHWAHVERRTLAIAGRAISSLIQAQGIGDLYQLFATLQRDEIAFHLAFIPSDFDLQPNEQFDPIYMKALFEVGYQMGKSDFPWSSKPPGFAIDGRNRSPILACSMGESMTCLY